MRLWHVDLIKVLPMKQLVSQWRECCCIAKNIANKGTPNHLLVNKVLEYHYNNFNHYTMLVVNEMKNRGYKVGENSISNFIDNLISGIDKFNNSNLTMVLFEGWHNERYLNQCYYNFQEKYDCGGISKEEWMKVYKYVNFALDLRLDDEKIIFKK